jgi:oligosaccharide reducing-end xylanase
MQRLVTYSLIGVLLLTPFLTACGTTPTPVATPVPATATITSPTLAPTSQPTPLPKPIGAFESGQYRNLFTELLGKSDDEVQQKIDQAWQQLFYGDNDTQRVYYPVGRDMAYITDVANADVRSEGMSYGMMLAVQLDKKEEFDKLWKWAYTYMLQKDGPYKGYFAWHNQEDGTQIDANPASDGEEWFAMALLFAANRWGNGAGIYNYQAEAQKILDVMLHKSEEDNGVATNMFDPETKQIVFVPSGRNATFTDPSYHLPAFYELWAQWADKDNDFWKEAAQVSRAFWKTTAHPETGLMPDYAEFDGKPNADPTHKDFRFDAFRNASNVALDWAWFAADPWQVEQSNRLLDFFRAQGLDKYVNQYAIDGKPLSGDRSSGLIAMNAVASLAADPQKSNDFVQALWDLEIPSGHYRYYDGLLYFLALLQASGNYRIYTPDMPKVVRPTPTPDPVTQAKFVPRGDEVLVSVGQGADSLDEYVAATGIEPGGVMLNTTLTGFTAKAASAVLDQHPDSALLLGLQVADSLADINSGQRDQSIDQFLDQLAAIQRPIYLRFGYDFDSAQQRTDPEQYKQAWLKFQQRLQAKQISNVALVWQSAAECNGDPIEPWYPGDQAVDWIGASYAAQAACQFGPVNTVLNFARTRGKPLLIAAAPQGYDIGQLSYSPDGKKVTHLTSGNLWKGWFQPFFDFIHKNTDVIRAVSYQNSGVMQVQANKGILGRWGKEIADSRYLQAVPDLFAKLGYRAAQP